MSRPLDLSRFHTLRTHPSNGMQICMYTDAPGVYFGINGTDIDDETARVAGFKVDEDRKKKLRNELMEQKKKEVDDHMAQIEQEVDAMVESAGSDAIDGKEDLSLASTPFAVTSEVSPPVIVKDNAKGEPRETDRRKMEGGQAGRWSVIDKGTGEKVHPEEYVDTRTAQEYLMEQRVS